MQLGDKILDRKELVEHNGGCKLSRTAAQIALYAPIEMQKWPQRWINRVQSYHAFDQPIFASVQSIQVWVMHRLLGFVMFPSNLREDLENPNEGYRLLRGGTPSQILQLTWHRVGWGAWLGYPQIG